MFRAWPAGPAGAELGPGHPARAVGLRRFLDYIQGHEGVWVARRSEIAEHWHKTFPYQPGMEQISKATP